MIKPYARRWSRQSGWIVAIVIVVLFALATGALSMRGSKAADDGNRGSRITNLRHKRLPNPAVNDSKKRGATSSVQSPMLMPQTLSDPNAPRPVLAIADFDLIGLAVTASPATQTVPKNTATAVLTSVQVPLGGDPAQIIAGLNPSYRVRGELTGPSLTNPLVVEAPIGQPLPIPPLSRAGDHALQNLRVVDIGATGTPVVTSITPDTCGIVVIDQLLISQVRVEELSYEEIVQSGITVTDDSYQFFNFVLALTTSSQAVNISIPVAMPEQGAQDPRPVVGRPNASLNVGTALPAVDVAPIMLAPEDVNLPENKQIEFGGKSVRIPGVVVFPGRIGLLHQFFEAIVIVANGAPSGAPLVVRNLRSRVILPDGGTPADPSDDPLRIAPTQVGGAVSELEVHGLGPDGVYGTPDDVKSFSPGQSGQATFLLEGLKEGLHSPKFELVGTLEGLPIGPITVRGEVPGAVLVRDASFAVTFSHPSVVRAGNEYDLAMTLYNSGSRDIQGAIARLSRNSISGADLIGNDTGERAFATTVPKKGSSTVVWRLKANITGAVTASYAKVGQGIEAGLTLTTGVGDRNVPLSPDSLILPDEVRFLPPDVVEAGRALLGQAWSVATAPRGSLPQGVTPISKETVISRAAEIGVAGLRVEFGEPVQVSLETLMRDWLGELQQTPDPGFADAMRDTVSGFRWHDSIGTYLYSRLTAAGQPLTPAALHQELAGAESPRSPFVSALVTQPNGAAIFGARLIDPSGRRTGFIGSGSERVGEVSTAASMRVSAADGTSTLGQMLVASRVADGNWSFELTGWQAGSVDISLLIPAGGKTYRQVVFSGAQITQGGRYRITFRPGSSATPVLEEFRNGAFQAISLTPSITMLNEPAPRLVGAIQVSPDVLGGGDKYGRLVGLLFSKPMQKSNAQTASRYRIGGGELIGSSSTSIVGGPIKVNGSKLALGGRFVFLGLDAPIGPYIRRDVTITGLTDEHGGTLNPSPTVSVITPKVSFEGRPPGAYLTGRVLLADGTPVANAPVVYRQTICERGGDSGEPLTVRLTDPQGRYSIDYVRNSDCGPPIFSATNPANASVKLLSTPVVYNGQHLVIDLVFLARGSVRGTVTIGGAPAPNAFVRVVPSLDASDSRVVQADGLGRYLAEDLTVGSVTVLAVGAGSQSNATGLASGTISGPGQTAVVDVSLQSISGVVRGRVVNPDGASTPSVGSLVIARARLTGVSSELVPVGFDFTDRDGSFKISNLPLTDITLEVRDYVTGLTVTQQVQLSQTTREVNGVVMTLPGLGSVSGKVVDESGKFIPQAIVQAAGREVQADALGSYTLTGMVAGTHTIRATEPLSGSIGTATATVRMNETAAGVNITITRPGAITGQVFSQNGTPISGAKVTHDGINQATTDSQGRYTLRNIEAGRIFTLRFVHPNNRLAVNYNVFVGPNETLTRNATFRSASLRGKVVQPDGVTGAVAELNIFAPLPKIEGGPDYGLLELKRISSQSAGDGTYSEANINPGTYRVTAWNSFFPTRVSKGGTLLAGEEQVCNLTLVNTLAGKIQGRVFNPDGTPVGAGVKVTLGGGTLADVTVQTDQNGRYEFAEVFAEGRYNLSATDPATGNTNRIGISVRTNEDSIADIRLLGRGGLRVRLIDGAGVPVQGGSITVEGANHPFSRRFSEITAQSGGIIAFDNLTEGPYAISATQNGLSGRVSAFVPNGSTVDVTVQLQSSGTVEGRVLMPDGTTPIGLADVTLKINGSTVGITITSDGEGQVGRFSFANVPAGEFTLEAFDNRTGRVGRAAGRIAAQGQTASVDIKLIPVGAVTGRVTSNGQPVDHALVTITAGGFSITNLKATTTPDGRYRFTGIPAGQVSLSVTNGPGGLTGSANGAVVGTTEPLPDTVIDIALEPSVIVAGTVYKFGGVEPMVGARVTLGVGARTFETTTSQSGLYRIEFVPLGEIRMRAEAPTGYNRGEAPPITPTQPGSTVTINVTLNGTGNVSGDALDNSGAKLSSGTVEFINDAFGRPVVLVAQVQSNGRYEIKDVPAGNFSIRLTVPNRVGVGTAAGVISANQTTELNVRLEDAGTVTGAVKQPDGATPAASTDVALTLTRANSSMRFYTHTNAQGVFTFENLPLGTVSIDVTNVSSGGVAHARGLTLATNGQTLNAGTLILDNSPIRVDSVAPANNATNVPKAMTVTVTFSEPALASTVNASSFKLVQGQTQVAATISLSADGRTATLTPSAPLGDFTSYAVVVTTAVTDAAGLHLASEFRSSFVTKDETGPAVTQIAPANNAVQVALASDVVVTFNEALDRTQNLTPVIKVTFGPEPGTAVTGSITLNDTGLVATLRPSSPLAESTRYIVTVTGQRDALGNVQTAVFTSSFTTVDLTAPVIDPLPIDGTRQTTFRPTITATYRDSGLGINTASVVLKLDGANVTSSAAVTGTGLTFQPSTPLATGSHTVTVQVADNAGNVSAIRSASFTIDNSAPVITSFTIAGVNATNGMTVTSTLQPMFAASYTDDSGINTTATRLLFGPAGSTPAQVAATVTGTNLTFQPASNLAEGSYTAEVIVVDNLGNTSTTGRIEFRIDVDAPEITSVTPSRGNQHGGTVVTLSGARLLNSGGTAPTVSVGGYPATVRSAAAGSPDQVVIITPPGAPGAATIVVKTDRGVGSLPGGFTYEADPKTPFAVEADTRLLWHLDESGEGAARVLDAGPLSIDGTTGSASQASAGRFGGGRAKSFIGADADYDALALGTSSFTVECWVKTDPVSRPYVLVGKSRHPFGDFEDFNLMLHPSGALQAYLFDTGNRQWSVTMASTTYDVDDNQWHSVAMVVDRAASKLSIYVDGVERASGAMPAGFEGMINRGYPLRAGHYIGGGSGPDEFPGVIDEIRISNTAHAAGLIQRTYQGAQGPLGLVVARVTPQTLVRGSTTEVIISGYNLANATTTITDTSGLQIPSQVIASSATEARVQVNVGVTTALGNAQLVLSSNAGTATVTLRVVDLSRSVFGVEADTRLLWHLDEPGSGASRVLDAGPLSIDGTAGSASQAVVGRFNGGRAKSFIGADADYDALALGTSSFTVECWVKTDPVSRPYVLVGKSRHPFGDFEDFNLMLHPSGALQAYLFDTGNRQWSVTMASTTYDVDDNQWHSVAMVVDRAASKLSIYVDGVERASGAAPAGFEGMINRGYPLRAGHYIGGGSGPDEFPGVIDEIRLSNTAHAAEKIGSDFYGFNAVRVTSVMPSIIQRGTIAVPFTFSGMGLAGATVTPKVAGVIANVTATSYTRINLTITVPDSAPLGPLQFTVTDALGQTTNAELTVVDQRPFVNDPASNSETILLWHLDEAGDGAVPIIGVGDPLLPAVIGGTAGSASQASAGRFGGGRTKSFIAADAGSSSFSFSSSSFTVECWVKTDPVSRPYVLVGKSRHPFGDLEDFNLMLHPSGALQAYLFDTGQAQWTVTMPPFTYDGNGQPRFIDVDNGQWHLIAMVLDRSANKLSIYVDGVERASAAMPAGFGAMINRGYPLRAGHYIGGGSGPEEFPGVIDEIRIVNYARTAAQIRETWFGTATAGINFAPMDLFKRRLEPIISQRKEPLIRVDPKDTPTLQILPPASPPSLLPKTEGSARTAGGER